MESRLKGCLKAIVLELRRELEGSYDARGSWQPGDLERRLAAIGVRKDRTSVPVDELPHLPKEDREARRVVDAFLESRAEAGLDRASAAEEFVRQAAYTWANRLLALRCMEARSLIDEVILQKEVYGGRSLQHNRLAKKAPERCGGEDEGLFATLFDEFERRAKELPLLFSPEASEVALRPSVPAIKRCVGLLSGTVTPKGPGTRGRGPGNRTYRPPTPDPGPPLPDPYRNTDQVFIAPDTLGWAYQYWNTEEKDRVFEKVRTKKGAKIEGSEIVPATCIYTEPYMVKFLVQNSLGALWMGMVGQASSLPSAWEYYVPDADRVPVQRKPVREITFLDPACGSGHFLIEAFDLFYAMYEEEGAGGQGTGVGEEKGQHDSQELPGSARLASSDGPRGGDIPPDSGVSEVGDVRTCEPDAAGRDFGPIEHRGGAHTGAHEGVSLSSVSRTGFPCGAGNAGRDRDEAGLSFDRVCDGGSRASPGSGKADLRPSQLPCSQYPAPDPRSLTPAEICDSILRHNPTPDPRPLTPAEICDSILRHNLYGIDIDERAVQIAALALVMKAKEKTPDFVPRRVNLVATNIRFPAGKDHLEAFLRKHPDDTELKPALLAIFEGLAHADELGSLLQIEEPVERELKHIRGKLREKLHEQLTFRGPKTEEDWEAWKTGVIERLRQHFDAEAHAPDLVTALFGGAGARGLSLVDVLARRYDIVAANPPYMGSKNMGAIVKKHVERHFTAGKRDLYAAFILRCLELAAPGGRVAMVTQQSWMFLRSFADLRALDDEKRRKTPNAFSGVLRKSTIETLAHLGPRAFAEIGGEVVNTALFVLARAEPQPEHRLTAFRLIGPKSPEEKDALLREAIRSLGKGDYALESPRMEVQV